LYNGVMARKREYNRAAVLDAAVETFWHQGFEGTSVRDLVEACGLSSRSMYDGFGDKAGFFEAAMDHYYELVLTPVIDLLENGRGMAALGAFVQLLAKDSVEDGCLYVNTGVERANVPAAALDRVDRYRQRMVALFADKLEQARQDGDFAGDTDVRAMQLSVSLTGFVASLKCGAKIEEASIAMRAVLSDIQRDSPT